MRPQLYSWQFCPFAQRTRIALALKGVDFELVEVDLTRPRPAALLARNPGGQVPTLVVGNTTVYESDVLGEFVDEAFDGPQLMPRDAAGRAALRTVIALISDNLVPAMYRLLLNQDVQADEDLRGVVLDQFRRLESFMALHATGDGLFLRSPSLAEAAMGPFFQRWEVVAYYREVEIPKVFGRILEWRQACLDMSVVEATAADRATLIKVYADYARGTAQAARPDGAAASSFDVAISKPELRPMPPVGLRMQTI